MEVGKMINYNLLAKAQEYYSQKGFTYIEVPWYVSEEVINMTRPIDKSKETNYKISTNNKYLVASGEQGFIYLHMKGFLPEGRYCTITPCFRFDEINSIHRKVFMKCELIHILNENKNPSGDLSSMIDLARGFYDTLELETRKIIVEDHFDLIDKEDIELGSYGIREFKKIKWIYGTGCAEPRTSYCLKNS